MDSFRDGFQAGYQHGAQEARAKHAELLHEHARDVAANYGTGSPREAYQRELEQRVQAQTGSFAQGGIVPGRIKVHIDASTAARLVEDHPAKVAAGFSLPQRYIVLTYALVHGEPIYGIYGADQTQGMSQVDAEALAKRLLAQDRGMAPVVLPITPEAQAS